MQQVVVFVFIIVVVAAADVVATVLFVSLQPLLLFTRHYSALHVALTYRAHDKCETRLNTHETGEFIL